jgi:hypothetical protein
MPRTLPTALHLARHLLASERGWLLLVELPLKGSQAGKVVRLVRSRANVTAGDGHVFQAADIELAEPAQSIEGGLAPVRLAMVDLARRALPLIESEDCVLGQTLSAWIVHESVLPTLPEAVRTRAKVLRATLTESGPVLECGHPAQIGRAPGPRFAREQFPVLAPASPQELTAP